MGNETSSTSVNSVPSTKQKKELAKFGFSWQKRKKDPPELDKATLNKADFWIKERKGECIQRSPGFANI